MITLKKDTWYVRWFRYVLEMKFALDYPTHENELRYWYDGKGDSVNTPLSEATFAELLQYLSLGSLNLCLFIKMTTYMYLFLLIRKYAKILSVLGLNVISWLWLYEVRQRPDDILWFVLSVIFLVLGALVSMALLCIWLEEKYKEWKYKQPIKNREESFVNRIVKPYLKARKENICPMIEVKD